MISAVPRLFGFQVQYLFKPRKLPGEIRQTYEAGGKPTLTLSVKHGEGFKLGATQFAVSGGVQRA
jgi:hypothetical protein